MKKPRVALIHTEENQITGTLYEQADEAAANDQ